MSSRNTSLYVPLSAPGTSHGPSDFPHIGDPLSPGPLPPQFFDQLFPELPRQAGGQPAAADCGSQHNARQTEARPKKQPKQEETDRVARVQLKNRTAQSRYRQRQKEKVEEYKATIETLTQQLEALKMEKAQLQDYNSLLQKVARNRDEQSTSIVAPMPAQVPASQQAKLNAMCAAILEFMQRLQPHRRDLPRPLTVDFIKNQTASQHFAWRQEYITQLGSSLLDGGDVVDSPAHKRLVELIQGHRRIALGMADVHPRLWRQLESGLKSQPCPQGTWRRVLEAMALTPEQKRHLLESRQRLLRKMQDIVHQRKKIVSVLQVAVPGMERDHKNATSFVRASQAADELQASLDAEHRAVVQFLRDGYCSEIISPLQEARGEIEASPYFMDTLAICNAIAEEAGEPAQLFAEVTGYFEQFDQQPRAPVFARDTSLMPSESPFHALAGLPVGPDLADGPSAEPGWLQAFSHIKAST
ncbi:hypothetical protein WJX72_000611 [[Myrmecia] bisecta]|uniref:BZIP domain-containing protein n=1 Tax=[Myrmecia] bisecta TaxID=41462 RepID=A0AAW1Q9R9_9CHLO